MRGRSIRPALDPAGRLTVRLQGIDSPELHYRPQAARAPGAQSPAQRQVFLAWNHDFRQCWAESATWALRQLLSRAGRSPLPCTVVTRIDDPGEAFDCYGRLVGDILVRVDGAQVNLNRWLARQGWAFPAFYSSMSAEFLEQGVTASRPRMLDAFVGVGGVIGIWPEEVVFQEPAATVVGQSGGEVLW